MTFLAIDAQKNLFTLQKSQLQFEQTLIMSRTNYITKQVGYYEEQYSDVEDHDFESDATYQQLLSLEQYYETRQDSLDTQITALDNEISSMQTLVTNNIKSGCTLNLIGG